MEERLTFFQPGGLFFYFILSMHFLLSWSSIVGVASPLPTLSERCVCLDIKHHVVWIEGRWEEGRTGG